jgi:hypothetical protein
MVAASDSADSSASILMYLLSGDCLWPYLYRLCIDVIEKMLPMFFHCCVHIHFRGNMLTKLLHSSGHFFWLHSSGFQPSNRMSIKYLQYFYWLHFSCIWEKFSNMKITIMNSWLDNEYTSFASERNFWTWERLLWTGGWVMNLLCPTSPTPCVV